MNVILLSEQDFDGSHEATLGGRRFEHVRDVHRAKIGDVLRVGLIGGKLGTGVVTRWSDDELSMSVSLDQEPPPPLPLALFMALPRPKFIARILQNVTSLGVKKIYVFNSYRVDKVYWSCEQITETEVRESCLLGLEQARDTILPEIHFKRLFKPFVEDELPGLIEGTKAYVAHPGAEDVCPFSPGGHLSLAVGPEGGFIEYELEKLQTAGFQMVRTYDRILKVETAITSLIGRLV